MLPPQMLLTPLCKEEIRFLLINLLKQVGPSYVNRGSQFENAILTNNYRKTPRGQWDTFDGIFCTNVLHTERQE